MARSRVRALNFATAFVDDKKSSEYSLLPILAGFGAIARKVSVEALFRVAIPDVFLVFTVRVSFIRLSVTYHGQLQTDIAG